MPNSSVTQQGVNSTSTVNGYLAASIEFLNGLAGNPEYGAAAADLAGAAMSLLVSRVGKAARAGAAGGRPKGTTTGPRAWYAVMDSRVGRRYTQDLAAVADWLDLATTTLTSYMSRRGAGGYTTTREGFNGTYEIGCRHLNDEELQILKEGQVPEGDSLWAGPAADSDNGALTRRGSKPRLARK